MRRRNWFAVTAVMAASLAIGAGMALAAAKTKGHHHHGKGKAMTTASLTTLKCHVSLTVEPPAGSDAVPAPVQQGTMYGKARCSGKHLGGSGVEAAPFTVPDSGDTKGHYTQYFKAGTIKGAFDWSPQEAPPVSGTSFQQGTWTGTATVASGTGSFQGIKGKNGKGKMNCSSPDNVHFSCTEKVKVKL